MAEFIPTNTVKNEVVDIDLSVTERKKFRFNHDDSRIVELNTSDMGIIHRMDEAYPKLTALQEKAGKLTDGLNTNDESSVMEDLHTMADRLEEVDAEMRNLIDYIFDAEVSKAAAPDGSMYDPFNGSLRYEYIITTLIKQYTDNLQGEFSKMEKQFKKHTDKYTKRS